MHSRRSFFSNVLLPWCGTGAVALASPTAVSALVAAPASLPFSAQCLAVRHLKRELQRVKLAIFEDGLGAHESEWWWLQTKYRESSLGIASRSNKAWRDCVELAEIAWPFFGDPPVCEGHWKDHVLASLINGVLDAGGGERFCPRESAETARHG